jgi:hypothetical protein
MPGDHDLMSSASGRPWPSRKESCSAASASARRLQKNSRAVPKRDGRNDAAARLSRPGVWRLAFGMSAEAFAARFGGMPARPPKGRAVALPGWDFTRLDELTPHPVYAWMGWVQILSPSRASFDRLQPLLAESLDLARARWHHRGRHASH